MADRQAVTWDERFESERVRMLLDRLGLSEHYAELARDHMLHRDVWRLSFESFYRKFPTFPVLIGTRCRVRIADKHPLRKMFRAFDKLPIMDDYLSLYGKYANDNWSRPVAMVFPFDGYKGGLAMHNGDFSTGITKLVHEVGDVPPYRVTMEPFGQLLDSLVSADWVDEWSSTGLSVAEPAQPSVRWTPTMVGALGISPSLLIYSWIEAILRNPAGMTVRRNETGCRMVATTRERIAEETGLSLPQVKRGLAELRSNGWLETSRREGGLWLIRTSRSVDDADS